MCGIAGAVGFPADEGRLAVEEMCAQMRARGPDDEGVETLPGRVPVVLGSRRLAIIDPSPAGHQPMWDRARGTTVVFNGMIYNFAELRAELASAGESFVSDCDTEVVLKAYGRWGDRCVERLRGMFAFAVWDGRTEELFLARDRFGIKPLYHTSDGERFLFASQVKALAQTGLVPTRLSPEGIRSFLAYGAVGEPVTALEAVKSLPAAHTARLVGRELRLSRYWEPPARPELELSREEAVAALRQRLEETVGRHLVSDAPLGVFLSGGLDSSVVAALAARHTSRLRTVSVVFDDPQLSEAPYTELVAKHVGSEHVQIELDPGDLLSSLGDAFDAMDQPSFDGINTYAVSRAAGLSGLKVALSGLGSDELFDGYGYVGRVAALERARRLPAALRRPAGRAVGSVLRGGRGAKLGDWLDGSEPAGSSYDLLRRVFSRDEVERLVRVRNGTTPALGPVLLDPRADVYNQVSVLDLTNYTRNVLLRDTDAMSMASSVEVRVPYLDHPLAEWALRLPAPAKGRGKALLVAACADVLPRQILERRKQGFVLPFARWLRGELRGEVDEQLRRPPEAVAELVETSAAREVWSRFLLRGERWVQPWALFALARWTESLATVRPTIAR